MKKLFFFLFAFSIAKFIIAQDTLINGKIYPKPVQTGNKSLPGYFKLNQIIGIRNRNPIFINDSCCYKRQIISICMNFISVCFQNNLRVLTGGFYFLGQNYFSIFS